MLKRKCGLRDKNIDDVRVFENYSLVSVPFSDAEAVVGQLNASGGRRRIAKIDGSDAENGGGKRRRPATEGPEANRPESLVPRRGAAGRPGSPRARRSSAPKGGRAGKPRKRRTTPGSGVP